MKLDDIQDIEILRKVLKATMCKCMEEIEIVDFSKNKLKVNKDEWYFYEYDRKFEEYIIYDGKGNYGFVGESEFEMHFFVESHIENGKWKIF
jgi:hypothetical protein